MAKNFVRAMVLVAICAVPQFAKAADAVQVQNDSFSITLPAGFGAFAKQAQVVKAATGNIETTNWVSKAPTGEAVVVTMSKMPGKILAPDKLIASTRDSLLKSLKATLESEEKRGGDMPSERLMFYSDSAFFRSRLVVTADRFYQVLYVGRSADQRVIPSVGEIFDSFRIETPATTVAAERPH